MDKEMSKMRRSQQIIFWRNHRIVELRKDGKIVGWYGCKPKELSNVEDLIQLNNTGGI